MRIQGDARRIPLVDGCVQTVVTSPPYFGLRDYGVAGQIGLERSPDAYVAQLVAVFREVRRVLKDDGTVWLNLGDSYATGAGAVGNCPGGGAQGERWKDRGVMTAPNRMPLPGLKPKDLIGIPWRVAFALQADGWYLRSDIIWAKPNPMPESVIDRPTKAHEYVFLLSKAERYYFDADAVREPHLSPMISRNRWQNGGGSADSLSDNSSNDFGRMDYHPNGRNIRSVWSIATQPYAGAHFATMPETLVERCVLAGSRPGDLVCDPFGGSGTTVRVARRLNRRGVMLELNPAYLGLAKQRTSNVQVSLLEAM